MDEKKELREAQIYEPRPQWQVWAARIGLVLFVLVVVYQVLSIAGGGA